MCIGLIGDDADVIVLFDTVDALLRVVSAQPLVCVTALHDVGGIDLRPDGHLSLGGLVYLALYVLHLGIRLDLCFDGGGVAQFILCLFQLALQFLEVGLRGVVGLG